MYDANGNLTRAGAEQVIKEGGTVHISRRVAQPDGATKVQTTEYRTVESLPSETEFAIGDPDARQKALDGLAAQRRALDESEQKLLAAAKGEEQARKDAERAQKEREQREAKDPKPPQTLHQQTGGRVLDARENELAEKEATERLNRAAEADPAYQRRQQQRGAGAPAAGDDDEPTFRGRKLSDFDGIADDQLTNEEGIGEATAADIVKARHKRDRARK